MRSFSRRPVSLVWCALVLVATGVMVVQRASVSSASTSQPNIVLIVSDDQPMDSLAAMPFLTSKPGGNWVDFPNAFVNTPLCCPSRATILTGLYSHHHGVEENFGGPFDPSSTIATWLQSAGYRTGLAGKYLNEYPFSSDLSPPPGWSDWFADMGSHRYYDYTMNDNGTEVTYGHNAADYHTDVVARRADTFIRSSAGEPFFLYATPIAPHVPLQPPPRYANAPVTVTRPPNFNEADVSDKPAWIQAKQLLTTNQAKAMDKDKATVHRMVMALDDLVRTVYTALEDTGTLENTVIVYMTDNGYMRGEHRQLGKSCVYEECISTPMFMHVPGINSRVEPKLVSNIDIAPTLAAFGGTVPADPVDGDSLLPLLADGGANWRSSILLELASRDGGRPTFWGIRTDEWKYSELETKEEELYDIVNDPYELQNRAGEPALAQLQAGLAAELEVLKAAPPHTGDAALSVGDAQVTEGETGTTPMTFTVTLSPASDEPVTVSYATDDGSATSPDDYGAVAGQLTFDPGATSRTVTVSVAGDNLTEGDESFTLQLADAVGAQLADGTATGAILDDDDAASSVSIGDVVVTEGNSGTTSAVFPVTLSPPTAQPVTVSWATSPGTATSPGDFQAGSDSLTFQPGETAKTITIPVVGDTAYEGQEVFSVDISSGDVAVADGHANGTINNDDAPPFLIISDITMTEGTGPPTIVSFVVTLSASSTVPATVNYATVDGTARAPSDYLSTSGTVTFAPGETVKTIQVSVVGDSSDERAESFTISLTNPTGASISDATGRCTINDND
jgi:N-acetylglucosamine-6-sulfatase